jgi:hypothetical protein
MSMVSLEEVHFSSTSIENLVSRTVLVGCAGTSIAIVFQDIPTAGVSRLSPRVNNRWPKMIPQMLPQVEVDFQTTKSIGNSATMEKAGTRTEVVFQRRRPSWNRKFHPLQTTASSGSLCGGPELRFVYRTLSLPLHNCLLFYDLRC